MAGEGGVVRRRVVDFPVVEGKRAGAFSVVLKTGRQDCKALQFVARLCSRPWVKTVPSLRFAEEELRGDHEMVRQDRKASGLNFRVSAPQGHEKGNPKCQVRNQATTGRTSGSNIRI